MLVYAEKINIREGNDILAKVDFAKLKDEIRAVNSKTTDAKDSSTCLTEFLKLLSNLANNSTTYTQEQLASLTMSLQNWMIRKDWTTCNTPVKIGDIFYADLGNCYKPELAYPHPVVILEDIAGMVMVAPVTTSKEIVDCAFHPINNVTGKKEYRKAGTSEGFEHDCAIIISNVRTISKGRLIEKKGKMVDINIPNSVFREVKQKAFELCFPKKFIEYRNMSDDILTYKNTLNDVISIVDDIKADLDVLNVQDESEKVVEVLTKINEIKVKVEQITKKK